MKMKKKDEQCPIIKVVGNNSFSPLLFQDVKLNGNKLGRVPTEALRGPESLQNLQLQDNFIGKWG